ncbi:hypothetical protein A1O7_07818 [Cladophialophora yegresii CBS 114405]|uniref:Uncharacterized protein n=1 Tax=Cladophialophora yegresii CBS 114405 TaxID=1182544 RepID=W9VXP0_9EURO|nr:uncharacterized protein A1O7_07818 [Cladophialophora yegresii CBS 114405]EXJ57470.1 hypothetical protein A1O7_07818 [Cladophialophora yegresii CBS 114405]
MDQLSFAASGTEMQYLHPGRLSDQSSRTAISTDQGRSKSEQLLQAILDALKDNKASHAGIAPAKTDTKDFVPSPSPPKVHQPVIPQSNPSRPYLPRGTSTTSSGSSHSTSGCGDEQFYQQLFTAVVAFAAFGGSITFQCIFQTMPDTTENKHITPKRARTFIAISWLLFTMDLSLSSIVLAALYVCKTRSAREGEHTRTWHKPLHRAMNLIAALVLPLGSVAALIFAALAVSVLSLAVGETALVSVAVLGGSIVLWWFSFCIRYCYRQRKGHSPA